MSLVYRSQIIHCPMDNVHLSMYSHCLAVGTTPRGFWRLRRWPCSHEVEIIGNENGASAIQLSARENANFETRSVTWQVTWYTLFQECISFSTLHALYINNSANSFHWKPVVLCESLRYYIHVALNWLRKNNWVAPHASYDAQTVYVQIY